MNQYSKTDELFVTVTHAADHSALWLAQWKRPGMGSAPPTLAIEAAVTGSRGW